MIIIIKQTAYRSEEVNPDTFGECSSAGCIGADYNNGLCQSVLVNICGDNLIFKKMEYE